MKPRKPKKPKSWAAPACMHCAGPVRLTTGAEIYPARPDLAGKNVWVCACGARVGCHGASTRPLGRPANSQLRDARTKLHQNMIDPLWKTAVQSGAYKPEDAKAAIIIQTAARSRVYAFLGARLGLAPEACHISLFDIDTCRRAWRAVSGVSYPEIRDWAIARKIAAAIAEHAPARNVPALKHAALDICQGCRTGWTLEGNHHPATGEACAAIAIRNAIASIEAGQQLQGAR